MSLSKKKREEIFNDILDTILKNPANVVGIITKKHNISSQTVYKYLKILEKENKIKTTDNSKKKGKMYFLNENSYSFEFSPEGLREDVVWLEKIKPVLPHMPKNVYNICEFGFSEMLNNAIEHAEANKIKVYVEYSPLSIRFFIIDNGIGIFKKIQSYLNLPDPRYSVIELAKGKITSDPARHTGEGIFFTSKAFDFFIILSNGIVFKHNLEENLLDEYKELKDIGGTAVVMGIDFNSSKDLMKIFDEYTETDNNSFIKTKVPIKLMRNEGMELISRSQARRLASGFEKFAHVTLDFEGVEIIGQAFADELFRVFPSLHPDIHLEPINTNENVRKMIAHVLNNN
ncbi:MAG: DUF4325 domain-containing protein [Thermoplasmata archaeon]